MDRDVATRVSFAPSGESIAVSAGETLLECARRAAVPLSASCGGAGTCMSCTVQIVDGVAPEPSDADREMFSAKNLAEGWRRACQVRLGQGCTVRVPGKSALTASVRPTQQEDFRIALDPPVRTRRIRLDGAPAGAAAGHDDRLLAAINRRDPDLARSVDPQVMARLAGLVEAGETALIAAIFQGEVVNVVPARRRALALAIDLGTTTIGGFLLDLRRGSTAALCHEGLTNPQVSLGGDVVTRLNFAVGSDENRHTLQRLALTGINRLAASLCAKADAQTGDIVEVVIGGNTVMQHLALGLPVAGLARAPFVSLVRGPACVKARPLGIDAAPAAYAHFFPGIGGFVGGDHVAVILAFEARQATGTSLLVDIGTNTEISLIRGEQISSLSCPSGPALEGGEITWGMAAASGAIDRCTATGTDLSCSTIDAAPAEGICGSGVVDLVAALRDCGAINFRGRLQAGHPRVRDIGKRREFVLVPEDDRDGPAIVFTQADVRAVQLAKGAIRAGIALLLARSGVAESALDRIVVAGAFGMNLSLPSAVAIGMLPELPAARYEQIGDAAGLGVRLACLSHAFRSRAVQIARQAQHIDMAPGSAFHGLFARHINLPASPAAVTRS